MRDLGLHPDRSGHKAGAGGVAVSPGRSLWDQESIRHGADQLNSSCPRGDGRIVELVLRLAVLFGCVLLSWDVDDNNNNLMTRLSGGHLNKLSPFGTVSKMGRKENLTHKTESLSRSERRMKGKQGGSPNTV